MMVRGKAGSLRVQVREQIFVLALAPGTYFGGCHIHIARDEHEHPTGTIGTTRLGKEYGLFLT